MNQKLIRLIEDNGLQLHGDIEHFAHLLEEAEREKCAQFADAYAAKGHTVAEWIARLIRSRGTAHDPR